MKRHMYDTITFYREKSGLTVEQLGKRLGISAQAVSQWKTKGISDDNLKTVVALLHIPSDEMVRAAAMDEEVRVKEALI